MAHASPMSQLWCMGSTNQNNQQNNLSNNVHCLPINCGSVLMFGSHEGMPFCMRLLWPGSEAS